VWAHVSLAELRAMEDGTLLEAEWITAMQIRWAARRGGAADGTGSDGGAWLNGDAARAIACDASITPIVTGDVDLGALDDLVRLCLELAGHGAHCHLGQEPTPAVEDGGHTSLQGCELLRSFHHQVVIHRWGWTLTLNPDGTTTAWNPDRTKVLHSHGPPARAG
jgi:hypothetical protein